MRIVAIVQARMGSTRLPGKVMIKVLGRPLLYHFIERMKRAKKIDQIVIATPDKDENRSIILLANEMGIEVFKGSENNVLDRFYQTAKKYKADVIVRVTSDCPLIDASVVDSVIDLFLKGGYDYVSNNIEGSFPHGLDTEVFSFKALEEAHNNAVTDYDKEHVTPYIRNTSKFVLGNLKCKKDLSGLRWTVDYPEDIAFVQKIFEFFEGNEFTMQDTVDYTLGMENRIRFE
ncbi:3-deoxy-manno-octulosonate cytidylyltransferase [archaeon BMS3Abin16]|nr:3-deoxy-manno-octulosonate cytidylyltransferase [archaeon BMS3Abin16]